MKGNLKVISPLWLFMFFNMLLFSQQLNEDFKIKVSPVFNGEKLQKDDWYVSKKGDSIQFNKVKFYLTDFKFDLAENSQQKIINNTVLVDAFDKKTLLKTLQRPLNKKDSTIQFSLGVSGVLSESGALSGDFDPANGMYWAWQSGYINIKIEGMSPSCPTRKNKFTFHIGGFQKSYPTLRVLSFPIKEYQNEITLVVDLATFLNEIDLKEKHSVMIPGEKASKLADIAVNMFDIK
ncbi:MAG: hypothetical protein HRT69_15890 [Flavobacteriaceae bacterium]|nr:hypothetical protein [Flavobacteriaceae bacterium]